MESEEPQGLAPSRRRHALTFGAIFVLLLGWATLTGGSAAAQAAPTGITPADMADVCGDTAFSWTSAADEFVVYAGSSVDRYNYFLSSVTSDNSVVMTGLPTNGETVYVRLWYRNTGAGESGLWMFSDYTYTACAGASLITAPPAGAELCGSASLAWTNNADEYWVWAGSTAGSKDYFDSGSLGDASSTTVLGLARNGEPVYIRLWYRSSGGTWFSQDSTYATCTSGGVEIASPAAESTLACGANTITWTGIADEFWIYAGSTEGGSEYFDSGNLGSAVSASVLGLPSDGATVYVRLFYRTAGGTWASVDTTYVACNVQPTITAPTAGATVCGSATLTWTDAADEYWVYAGTSAGSAAYANVGSLGDVTTATITGLPIDGSTVYVRLWFRDLNATWRSVDTTYASCNDLPAITSPAQNLALCSSATVTWSGGADEYWLYAGSTKGGNEHFDSGSLGGSTSQVVTNLPTDGSMIYMRLFYRDAGEAWKSLDATYGSCSIGGGGE